MVARAVVDRHFNLQVGHACLSICFIELYPSKSSYPSCERHSDALVPPPPTPSFPHHVSSTNFGPDHSDYYFVYNCTLTDYVVASWIMALFLRILYIRCLRVHYASEADLIPLSTIAVFSPILWPCHVGPTQVSN